MRVAVHGIAIASLVALGSHACAQPPTPPAAPVAAAQSVAQANGNFTATPLDRPASRKSGLVLFADTHWANGYGYRPVEVVISSPTPTTTDHLITIQLHCGLGGETSVEQDFELPLGGTRASTNVAVPIYAQDTYFFWWDVWVDGVKDADLSIDKDDALRRSGSAGVSVSGVKVLVPGPDANHKRLVSTNFYDFEVLSLKLGDFPRRWIDYTCLDVVSLSTAELQMLARTNPSAFEAIGRWVRAGGQLWVSDVGDKLEQLPLVSKLLQVPNVLLPDAADSRAIEASENRPTEVGWRPARFRGGIPEGQAQGFADIRSGRSRWVSDPKVIAALEGDANFIRTNQQGESGDENPERRWPPNSSQWFVEQRLGLGVVRAFHGANEAGLFANSPPATNASAAANGDSSGQLPRALAMALRSTRHWDTRHGVIPDSSNPEFAKLLVPGVGLAPVTEFQVLITLFVLLIGPVNYWLLKRFKRLQLLVLTVPLAAGVATVALFAYAIASDGFSTTVRIRSFTTLDQRTGEAACWARLSYYSGLAPGQGLTMPADVVVYPVLPSWSNDGNRNSTRAMLWDENEAKLTRGWLNSRTPTQYLTIRSRKTPHRLDVVAGGGKVRVTNRLGTQIESLLVIDEAGKFFGGEQLANESKAALEAISRDAAVKRIVQLVRDNEAEAPAALTGSDPDFSSRRGRSARRIYGRSRSQISEDQLTESLASRALTDLAGLNGRPALDLPPRSYVAVTTSGPEVETGIPSAKEESSFHVIMGQW